MRKAVAACMRACCRSKVRHLGQGQVADNLGRLLVLLIDRIGPCVCKCFWQLHLHGELLYDNLCVQVMQAGGRQRCSQAGCAS